MDIGNGKLFFFLFEDSLIVIIILIFIWNMIEGWIFNYVNMGFLNSYMF